MTNPQIPTGMCTPAEAKPEMLSSASSADEAEHLDRRMVKAIAWTGAATWSAQLMSWLCTIVVARLLTPSDYGLVGMATIFIGVVMLVSEFGMGVAIVALRDLTRAQVAQLNTLSLLLGAAWFLLSCAVAYPLSIFFKAPQLPAVIVWMSTAFLIGAFRTVPGALLRKALQFKLLAQIEAGRTATGAVVTVLLAVLGCGYWSLVAGQVVAVASGTVMTLTYQRHPFEWIRFHSVRHSLQFSWQVMVADITWYAYSNSDFVVAGRVLGQAALGSYTFAWTLASLPVEKISSLVVRVVPSFFSAVQTEKSELRRYLLALTEGLLLITLPISLGLSLVAGRMIPVIFGSKWATAAAPLSILALYASVRSITTMLSPLLNARGESRFPMWVNVAAVVYFPVGFYVGSRWGSAGIAVTWVLLYPLVAVPLYWRVFRQIDLNLWIYLRALRPAIQASAAMTVAILLARWAARDHIFGSTELMIEVASGALVYVVVLFTFYQERLQGFYRIIRPSAKAHAAVRSLDASSAFEMKGNADSAA